MSSIQTDTKGKKKQYVFKLIYKLDEDSELIKDDNRGELGKPDADSKTASNRRSGKKDGKKEEKGSAGTKVAAVAVGGVVLGALTAGIGLLAGMMVVGAGAAAGGSAVALSQGEGKERYVLLASDTQEDAEAWVAALEKTIDEISDNVLGLPTGTSRSKKQQTVQALHPDVRIDDVEDWVTNTKWKVGYSTSTTVRDVVKVRPM